MEDLKIIVIGVMLTSCVSTMKSPEMQAAEYGEYVARFERASVLVGHPTKIDNLIILTDITIEAQGDAGKCSWNGAETPIVHINPLYWNSHNDSMKEMLIFHELAHCVLKRHKHTDSVDSHGFPTSIMNTCACSFRVPGALPYYDSHKLDYWKELFNTGDRK